MQIIVNHKPHYAQQTTCLKARTLFVRPAVVKCGRRNKSSRPAVKCSLSESLEWVRSPSVKDSLCGGLQWVRRYICTLPPLLGILPFSFLPPCVIHLTSFSLILSQHIVTRDMSSESNVYL